MALPGMVTDGKKIHDIFMIFLPLLYHYTVSKTTISNKNVWWIERKNDDNAMMVFHAISKKILSNCHSVKSEPMLMNYEKCDQVLFPLLQQKPGPSSLKKEKLWHHIAEKKSTIYFPPSLHLFQSCISDWWIQLYK